MKTIADLEAVVSHFDIPLRRDRKEVGFTTNFQYHLSGALYERGATSYTHGTVAERDGIWSLADVRIEPALTARQIDEAVRVARERYDAQWSVGINHD